MLSCSLCCIGVSLPRFSLLLARLAVHGDNLGGALGAGALPALGRVSGGSAPVSAVPGPAQLRAGTAAPGTGAAGAGHAESACWRLGGGGGELP